MLEQITNIEKHQHIISNQVKDLLLYLAIFPLRYQEQDFMDSVNQYEEISPFGKSQEEIIGRVKDIIKNCSTKECMNTYADVIQEIAKRNIHKDKEIMEDGILKLFDTLKLLPKEHY